MASALRVESGRDSTSTRGKYQQGGSLAAAGTQNPRRREPNWENLKRKFSSPLPAAQPTPEAASSPATVAAVAAAASASCRSSPAVSQGAAPRRHCVFRGRLGGLAPPLGLSAPAPAPSAGAIEVSDSSRPHGS
ncbi:hypothetical protein PVAP13_9KG077700 [Panicum virgatum]|uniref:Uncharacterized protein n=1 Tax=Panicum virgatum TaxID=38727 RepID=A0A8T0NJN7_PANVG|nr:hypothetical protein PVAP13_9KG077700 [Panicum virgatum]